MKTKSKLGQHFLKSKKILRFLANSLGDIHNKIVIEIGGGHGELTQFLTKAKRLVVYELDKNLAKLLKEKFPEAEIQNEDFLKAKLSVYKNKYFLIGNVPFYISGRIIRKILSAKEHPELAVLTFQKEFGEKILGIKGNNFIHSWSKVWCKVNKLTIIKKKYFSPIPRVDAIALRFVFYEKPLIRNYKLFEKFLKLLFRNPNRSLKNNLGDFYKYYEIEEELLSKKVHQLNFEEILMLFKKFLKLKNEKNCS